jgi:Zn-dependent protease
VAEVAAAGTRQLSNGSVCLWRMPHPGAIQAESSDMATKESRKIKLVGGCLAVVTIVGTATTIEGVVMRSPPIAITGLVMSIAAPAAWVLWAMVEMLVSLRKRLGRRPP